MSSPAPAGERAARTPEQERKLRRQVAAGLAAVRVLARTWRITVVHDEPLRRLRADGKPVIFSCWHGELLPLIWHHRAQGISILVSEHRDGELIARVAERIGFGTVRGSTSRGGGRALLALVRVLNEGRDIAVTPDGPRGPARQYAPGALVAAQRAGAPVLPVSAWVDRAWRLRSWDRFVVPKPFARIVVAYADPTYVAAGSPREAALQSERFTALHAEAERRAAAAARR